MEGEEIGMVLARASELRSKVNSCILDRARRRDGEGGEVADFGLERGEGDRDGEGEGEEDEEESLLNIRDALASLEQQLSSLQALQQQQLYERETTLAQIDRGRMILLSKLKEYKGDELEVIHEAAAFAGETIERDDDLLLPPYPRHIPDSLVLDDLYSSSFISKHKFLQNGSTGDSVHEIKNNTDCSKKQTQPGMRNGWGILGLVAKSALTVACIMSILSLSGFNPKIRRSGAKVKMSDLFQMPMGEEKRTSTQCPPGKVLVMEDGESRCVVKERVEIPFGSDVTSPNLSYGFG